jgi:hypothetical protein
MRAAQTRVLIRFLSFTNAFPEVAPPRRDCETAGGATNVDRRARWRNLSERANKGLQP